MDALQTKQWTFLKQQSIVSDETNYIGYEFAKNEVVKFTRTEPFRVYYIYANTEVSIYETISKELDNVKTIIIGMANSNIKFYTLNETPNNTAVVDIYLMKDAVINSNIIELSKQKANVTSNIYFLETGCHANANSVAIGNGTSDLEVTIHFIHKAKHTTAVMNNYGIAKDQSKIFYTGISTIEKGNSKTDSYQKTRGLNLSKDAKVIARPYLYIDEFDVIAGHGASIGSVSEDDLFYLMSRGLRKEEAQKMIINGFIRPLIDQVTDERFQETLIELIDQRLS